jgi:hypothetical protein
MSKERTRDLEEDPRHGKTEAVPFRRLLPPVVEDQWHLEIAATTQ